MSRGSEACRARVRQSRFRAQGGRLTERLGVRGKVTRHDLRVRFRYRDDLARSAAPFERRRRVLRSQVILRRRRRWGRGHRVHRGLRICRARAVGAAMKLAGSLVQSCQVVGRPAGGTSPIALGCACAEVHTQAAKVERIRAEGAHQELVAFDTNLAACRAVVEPVTHVVCTVEGIVCALVLETRYRRLGHRQLGAGAHRVLETDRRPQSPRPERPGLARSSPPALPSGS